MWNIYNIGADCCFGVGLIMKLIEYIILIEYTQVRNQLNWSSQHFHFHATTTGLDYKACMWLREFLPIFPKIAVRQTVGGRGAAEVNSKPCKHFSPTQYIHNNIILNPPLFWLQKDPSGRGSIVDQGNLAAAGRILWGAAFSLAIFKVIKVRIRLKFSPMKLQYIALKVVSRVT